MTRFSGFPKLHRLIREYEGTYEEPAFAAGLHIQGLGVYRIE